VPIHAYGGDSDVSTPISSLHAWKLQTTAAAAIEVWAGGHFFAESWSADFLASLRIALSFSPAEPRASNQEVTVSHKVMNKPQA
jgi:surfactin synthase thioesterase subunit